MKVKVVSSNKNHALIDVKAGEIEGRYRVGIVNNHGLFGVEYPPKLGVVLSRFPKESKALVSELRNRTEKLKTVSAVKSNVKEARK